MSKTVKNYNSKDKKIKAKKPIISHIQTEDTKSLLRDKQKKK